MQAMQTSIENENDYYHLYQGKKMKIGGNYPTKQFSTSSTSSDLKNNKKIQPLQKVPFGRTSEKRANLSENMVNGSRVSSNTQQKQQTFLSHNHQNQQQSNAAPLSTKFYSHRMPKSRVTPRKIDQQNHDINVPEITPLFQGKEDGILIESPTSGRWKHIERSSTSSSSSFQHHTMGETFSETPSSHSSSQHEIKEVSPSPISFKLTNPTLHSRVEVARERVKKLKIINDSPQDHNDSERNHLIECLKKDQYKNPSSWYAFIRREYKRTDVNTILNIINAAIDRIPEENKSHPDYAHLLIAKAKFVENADEKLAIFEGMMKKKIGIKNAVLYKHWAFVEQELGNTEKAIQIIKMGLENDAQPEKDLIDYLRTHGGSFDHSYSSTTETSSMQTVDYEPPVTPSLPEMKIVRHQQRQQNISSVDNRSLSIVEKEKWEKASKMVGTKTFYVNDVPYMAISILGQGGSGKVYQVLSPKFRIYALKIVKLEEEENIQQCIDEVKMLEELKGKTQHIIEIIDYEINYQLKRLSILFECAETDLNRHLKDKTMVYSGDITSLKFYWKSMLQAVAVVHKYNIVHGDLKPSNFVLVKGQLKLIDFGIAKAIGNNTVHIKRDHLAGTLNFMAPEAVANDGVSGNPLKLGLPSDIWSLGCILYQMVYGYSPFYHIKDTITKLASIVNPNHIIQFPHIGKKKDHIYLIEILRMCLNRNPKERPTITQLLEHPFLEGD